MRYLFLALLALSVTSFAGIFHRKPHPHVYYVTPGPHTIKIGVVDTGFDPDLARGQVKLCSEGHYDIPNNVFGLSSTHPHGTHVAELIAEGMGNTDYCIVIVTTMALDGTTWIPTAVGYLDALGVKLLNISLSGHFYYYEEQQALKVYHQHGGQAFVAAGNDQQDLNRICNVYPACYDDIGVIVVGAVKRTKFTERLSDYSNYGTLKVTRWMDGSLGNDWGTSYASPRALAEYALFLLRSQQ